jgi:predicted component of type VI protein secretion system
VSKLVLYLPDGSLHDIRLDKERLTIGRRADNDICLPYPAVSGEHACVVTILADSFLEDLGSTNGTLVNGQPVVKHFLRDNDHVDIGRQRLVYFMDEAHAAVPLAPDVLRREVIGLHEQVERAREMRGEVRTERPKPVAPPPAAERPDAIDPLFPDDELLSHLEPAVFPGLASAGRATSPRTPAAPIGQGGTPAVAMARHTAAAAGPAAFAARSSAASRLASTWTPVPEVEGLPMESTLPRPVVVPEVQPERPLPVPSYRVRVLTGANAGRELTISGNSVSVGSVGVQVARIAQQEGVWRLASLEGAVPLALNGSAIPANGAVLCPGDQFEVAGVQLAFESS